jgi:hypothetical protein
MTMGDILRLHDVDQIRSAFVTVRKKLDAVQAHHAEKAAGHVTKAQSHREAAEASQAQADKAARVASRIKATFEDDE